MNTNNIPQTIILANRNNIHEMKLWRIGIGLYLWPKYQRIDSWQIYLQTIWKLFANRELCAEHCFRSFQYWLVCAICRFLHEIIIFKDVRSIQKLPHPFLKKYFYVPSPLLMWPAWQRIVCAGNAMAWLSAVCRSNATPHRAILHLLTHLHSSSARQHLCCASHHICPPLST